MDGEPNDVTVQKCGPSGAQHDPLIVWRGHAIRIFARVRADGRSHALPRCCWLYIFRLRIAPFTRTNPRPNIKSRRPIYSTS